MSEGTLSEKQFRLNTVLSNRAADPLRYWQFAVPRLRDAIALYSAPEPVSELNLRACNKGTKSETEAAFVVSCLQKRPELDGAPIPKWNGKVEAAQLVLDFKQQLLSVQPAYQRVIGSWPHKIKRQGAYFESLYVKPLGIETDDISYWSVVHFLSQKNLVSGVGVRADLVAFDEPPVVSILDELRKAAHAGRRGIRLIGMTPIIRRQWAPIKEQYGNPPRKSLTRPNPYWAECRWSLDEVAEWVLSKAEKDELLFNYSKMPSLFDARVHGDYVDASGACPFHSPTLTLLLSECRDPLLKPLHVQRERLEDDGLGDAFVVELEVWEEPKQGKRYWVVIDPASGTDDGHGHHDPLGLLVLEMGSGNLVARYNGYMAPFSMGVLGAIVARQYNNAVVDVETADSWGAGVFRGLEASRYGNLSREPRELRPGEWIQDAGFKNTASTRPAIISAVQAWVDARRAGVKYGNCLSYSVIDCLLNCILDEKGKIVGAPGFHDEDLILWGEGLRRAVSLSGRAIPEIQQKQPTPHELMVAAVLGKRPQDDIGSRIPIQRAPERPRL